MSKIEIKNPLQKPIFKSFINQYIQIHYFKKGGDENREIENLKTLFFPPEHTDQLYSDLVSFVKIVIDKLVLNSLTLEKIKEDLSEEYEYDEETLNQINVIAMNNKNAIVDYINKPFNFDAKEFEKLNWSTKMVLSGNSDNYHGGKFADLEFCYKKANGDDSRIEHKTITFTKEDITVLMKEMNKIKENLNKITSIK